MRTVENRTGSLTASGSALALVGLVILLVGLGGCTKDDCVNCVELPAPVVPTGVHSISGDNEVLVQWYHIEYPPYDTDYNPNVVAYEVFRRDYPPQSPDFFLIGEVRWDENYDGSSGLHWFYDFDVINGLQYEYAVRAVNADGRASALSLEEVIDAPLPMSPLDQNGWFVPVRVYDALGLNADVSGFDFRQAALNPGLLDAGVVAPATADIHFEFRGAANVPYVVAGAGVQIQDFGVFAAAGQNIPFEAVGWAPSDGYSRLGELEVIAEHIYVVKITGPSVADVHYAKFGVESVGSGHVDIIWAYQLINGLGELAAPVAETPEAVDKPQTLDL